MNNQTLAQAFCEKRGIEAFQSLHKIQVYNAIRLGATLTNVRGVYSHWHLTFEDGSTLSRIRKNSTQSISDEFLCTRTEDGFCYIALTEKQVKFLDAQVFTEKQMEDTHYICEKFYDYYDYFGVPDQTSEQVRDLATRYQRLVKSRPKKSDVDYKALYEKLQEEFEQYKKESIKWSVEDFTDIEVEGYTITPDQAQEALERMIDSHDASCGIAWHNVEYWYQEFGTPTMSEDMGV